MTESTQPVQAALPVAPDRPDPLDPDPPARSAWFTKTPASRPPQSEIVVKPDQIINRQGKDFVLYAGLLDAAHKAGLQSISTHMVQCPSAANGGCAIVHADAEFPWGTFSGIGDADNENVSRQILPHKIRMAETRAKARALRDALSVGMVAAEEMGPDPSDPPARNGTTATTTGTTATLSVGGQEGRAFDRAASRFSGTGNDTNSTYSGGGNAAPRRAENRPDGSTSVTSSPGTRKSYGTPMTRPPVQG